jgi:hypothetical protein
MVEIFGYLAICAVLWFLGGALLALAIERVNRGGLEALALIAAALMAWSAIWAVGAVFFIGFKVGGWS